MEKKQGIFKEFQSAYQINPALAFAILWVTLMPSVGSIIGIPFVVNGLNWIQELDFFSVSVIFPYLFLGTVIMGFALMPTTLVAGVSGFIFGWIAFPILFLAYNMASLLGYGWGKKLSGNSLDFLLAKYPKANALIETKRNRIGELVFFGRLSPILPFAISNLIFALLDVGWKRLLLFGSIGMLPRTVLVFWSGTVASDIYTAISQDGVSWKGWAFIGLLFISIVGIWRIFKSK